MTTEKVSTVEEFDFPIERIPLVANIKGANIRTDKDCIVRTDKDEIIGYVSAKDIVKVGDDGSEKKEEQKYYAVIPHGEVVGKAREIINSLGLPFTEKTTMTNNGARLYHQFDFPTEQIEIPKSLVSVGDFVNMRITLTNSYDLSRKAGYEVGGLRKVCANGLMLFKSAFFYMYKHTGNFVFDKAVEELNKGIQSFRVDMLKQFEQLQETSLTQADGSVIISELKKANVLPEKYSNAVQKIWDNPENANRVVPILDAEGNEIGYEEVMSDPDMDKARNLWTFYNAITLILTHMVLSHERRILMYQQVQKRIWDIRNRRA